MHPHPNILLPLKHPSSLTFAAGKLESATQTPSPTKTPPTSQPPLPHRSASVWFVETLARSFPRFLPFPLPFELQAHGARELLCETRARAEHRHHHSTANAAATLQWREMGWIGDGDGGGDGWDGESSKPSPSSSNTAPRVSK
jgi:hypothetical protein